MAEMIRELARFTEENGLSFRQTAVRFTGSGALSLVKTLGIPFVQEVVAAADFLRHDTPDIDACVELGGEDAKILYLRDGIELRMNEACAGGTGAFIDQAATLLKTDAAGLDAYAREAKRIYPVASRCGVFAKTDFINLLNTGDIESRYRQIDFCGCCGTGRERARLWTTAQGKNFLPRRTALFFTGTSRSF